MKFYIYFTNEIKKLFPSRSRIEFDQKLLKHEFYAFIYILCGVNTTQFFINAKIHRNYRNLDYES